MTDPFDILLRYEPVDPAEIEAYVVAHAESVKQRILVSPRPIEGGGPARSDRPWRRVAAIAASIAVVAAAAFVVTRPAETTDAMTCYDDVALGGDRIGVQPESFDLSACADVWSDGSLVNEAIVPAGIVPPLVGCVDDRGTVAVFPTSDAGICDDLGFAVYDEAPGPQTGSIVIVQENLRMFIAAAGCASVADAAAEASAQLAAAGLTGWTVETGGSSSTRPCASFAVDDAAMTIHIIPIPRS